MIDFASERTIGIDLTTPEYEPFSREEELEIFKKYFECEDPLEKRKIRDNIICRNLRFVIYLINKDFSKIITYNNYDINYLFNIGCIGLMDAIDRFDPDKGSRFQSYASYRIAKVIYIEMYSNKFPVSGVFALRRTARYIENLRNKNFTDKQISKKINLSVNAINKLMEKESMLSNSIYLDSFIKSEPDNAAVQREKCQLDFYLNTPEDVIYKDLLEEDLKNQINRIFNDEQIFPSTKPGTKAKELFELYFYKRLTFREIASIYNTSHQAVQQLVSAKLRKIKKIYGEELKEYLY